jgi:predicted nicotinamide N-methyase
VSSTTSNGKKKKIAAVPVLLHDAPITDHISVGVQTWGSAILLGREMALRPAHFGLFQENLPHGGGTRILELGAGTGLLSILCRKLLDLQSAGAAIASPHSAADPGIIVATDFHPDVLSNLRVCVDLNATPKLPNQPAAPGIEIAKLDWTTFPAFMEKRAGWRPADEVVQDEELAPWVETPFDLVLVSDCVYDPTHAALLRQVAGWVLRLPSNSVPSGTMVRLSCILHADSDSITNMSLSTSSPRSDRHSHPSSSRSTSRSRLSRRTRRSQSAARPPQLPTASIPLSPPS